MLRFSSPFQGYLAIILGGLSRSEWVGMLRFRHLSMMSMDTYPVMLKQTTRRIKVRKRKTISFSISMMRNTLVCCLSVFHGKTFTEDFRMSFGVFRMSVPFLNLSSMADTCPCCPKSCGQISRT